MRLCATLSLLAGAHGLGAFSKRTARRTSPRNVAELPAENEVCEFILGDDVSAAPVRFEVGRLGRQADAAVMTRRGDTMVYTTLCVGSDEGGGDFCPMSVDYQERFSASGRTSGGYNKRDGRANEKEILISRLIDRPLRPTIIDGWSSDIQIISWVLAYDGTHSPEVLAILGASAALQLSRVPTICSVGASKIELKEGSEDFVLDAATSKTDAESALSLYVASADGSVLMVEGGAHFLPEEKMNEALASASAAACRAGAQIGAWADSMRERGLAEQKDYAMVRAFPTALRDWMSAEFDEKIKASTMALRSGDMSYHRQTLTKLDKEVMAALSTAPPRENGEAWTKADAKRALKKLCEKTMAATVRAEALRCDGRPLTEVRPIDCEMAFLPSVHGSAVFTRGETQSLATCTLGDASMAMRNDDALVEGGPSKRFYVQYTFPPSSVGETGRFGAPGRREIGHGALAERALRPALPKDADFPYAVRVESLITESCGSSSMATVCGGCLAMMDAGVPITRVVAGVAMGVILPDDDSQQPIVLTDILGVEDALGSMDFKVAGDDQGISAFQLDVKQMGLTVETLADALAQAKVARLKVLGIMRTAQPAPRATLSANVPKQRQLKVPPGLIGKIIGPRGATIKAMIEEFSLSNLDIQEDGTVTVSAMLDESLDAASSRIEAMKEDDAAGAARREMKKAPVSYDGPMPVVGGVYGGTVAGVKTFGAFVAFDDFAGLEGLCHISELAVERIRNIEKFIQPGERLEVKVLAVDEATKKMTLSRKAVITDRQAAQAAAPAAPAPQ